MVVRKKLETAVEVATVPDEAKRGVYVNRESLIALAQYGSPSKIFPLFLLLSKSVDANTFDLPDAVEPLPLGEEVAQAPNLLDIKQWLDGMVDFDDALLARQVFDIILARLPESYKEKAIGVL